MLGERIKACRKHLKINQIELADMLNVSQAAITAWEREARKPDVDMVSKIADVFGVSTDYLLGRTDSPLHEHKKADGSVVLSTKKDLPEQLPEEPTMRIDFGAIDDLPRDRKQLEELVSSMIRKALEDQNTGQ